MLSGLVEERFANNDAAIGSVMLKPEYQYLRVDIEGRRSALLVLGYVDRQPDGVVEVWYSAEREVVKTKNGRIFGTAGLETDWRMVRYDPSPPSWDEALLKPVSIRYTRFRDEVPGNRYSIANQVELQSLSESTVFTNRPKAGLAPSEVGYKWFTESTVGSDSLPISWFALGLFQGRMTVVYSKQCLSPSFCLSLTRWPQ